MVLWVRVDGSGVSEWMDERTSNTAPGPTRVG